MAEPVTRPLMAFMGLVTVCGLLIAGTAALTRERIEQNRARQSFSTLIELTGSAEAASRVEWTGDVARLCTGTALVRGAAQGYGGDIRWLAAAEVTGRAPALRRVRISGHQETPGIADFLEHPDSGWLANLQGADAVTLRQVEAVSGATITSRALARGLAAGLQRPALLANPECGE